MRRYLLRICWRFRCRPIQMFMKEAKRSRSINFMSSHKKFQVNQITNPHAVIEALNFGKFISHLFRCRHAI